MRIELQWIDTNPAKDINPATDEVAILFTDFMLEWLEMMKSCVEETTFASYTLNGEKTHRTLLLRKKIYT